MAGSGFLFVAETMRAHLLPCVVPQERLAQLSLSPPEPLMQAQPGPTLPAAPADLG